MASPKVAFDTVRDYTNNLGPAKTYILRGTPQTYAIKTRAATRQLDN